MSFADTMVVYEVYARGGHVISYYGFLVLAQSHIEHLLAIELAIHSSDQQLFNYTPRSGRFLKNKIKTPVSQTDFFFFLVRVYKKQTKLPRPFLKLSFFSLVFHFLRLTLKQQQPLKYPKKNQVCQLTGHFRHRRTSLSFKTGIPTYFQT